MQVFDFNIHLPSLTNEDVNLVIEDDLSLSGENLFKGFNLHLPFFKSVQGANFLLFNPDLFTPAFNLSEFKRVVGQKLPRAAYTALVNFRRLDLLEYLEQVAQSGVTAIMVNSYLQQIAEEDFPIVYKAFKFAEERGLIVCIDTSYGTSKMYTYDNMKLACFIADRISKAPIVLIHSGGYRVLEAMLLAMDKKNVYLDTSFSLPYYMGSSLEADFAYAYKKIGTNRIVFGSDHPYINYGTALETHLAFFHKHQFSSGQVEDVLFNTAVRLISHV